MRIAICDDEILFSTALEENIRKYLSGQEISPDIFLFSNPAGLFHTMQSNAQFQPVDIIFMDLDFYPDKEDGIF